ncbi:3,4-dihydroxy-2-butanone-4-phosphate synthase, partial [Nitratifractor sp.]
MSSEAIQRVEKAIDAIKKGRMVIMMDDEDRENEGDLVYAATFSTPEMVNFMAKEARGLICTPLTGEIARRLELVPMVERNDSQHETAFTVSIDAATAKTGISA